MNLKKNILNQKINNYLNENNKVISHSPESFFEIVGIELDDFGKTYDENIMKLMVRNSTEAYVYWDLNCLTYKDILTDLYLNSNIEENFILRIIELEKKEYSQEIYLKKFVKDYFFSELESGKEYKAELGYKIDNKYIKIISSNKIMVPNGFKVY